MGDLREIWSQFRLDGEFAGIEPCGKGHINDTLALRFRQPDGSERRYVLQKINQFVFKQPWQVMDNIEHVTAHLRAKITAAGGDPDRETLNLVPTKAGGTSVVDESGDTWRVYLFIEGASTYEIAETAQQIYNTAWAFGNFQKMLSDFPAGLLHETIPNFHNTPWRYQVFQQTCQSDPVGRARKVQDEIHFLTERKPDTEILLAANAAGRVPLRVTHNDTKLNNIMIDDRTGEAVCILDLDTVMPGLVLYDFGDAVRTAAARISEDDPEWTKAGILLENFESLAHGYLDAARDFLSPAEVDLLAFSARLITLEQAIRFLNDHLNGDVYYKIDRPDQNLDRARTQIKMVQEMEDRFAEMVAIVSRYR